jgi:hypothetical protein
LACGRFAISYTILSASHLMSAPLTSQEHYLRSERKLAIYGSSAGKGINYVSPNDVAEVSFFAPRTTTTRNTHWLGLPLFRTKKCPASYPSTSRSPSLSSTNLFKILGRKK